MDHNYLGSIMRVREREESAGSQKYSMRNSNMTQMCPSF